MAEHHEILAAYIRQYGTDPDGVKRAMLAAGYDEMYIAGAKDSVLALLRKAGYDVDGPAGMEAPDWAYTQNPPADTRPADIPPGIDWAEATKVSTPEQIAEAEAYFAEAGAEPAKRKPGRPPKNRGGK